MRSLLRHAVCFGVAGTAMALPALAQAQQYSNPIGCENCINWWYYVDQGNLTDYNCGSTTYSGHRGSDYSLRGGNDAIDQGNEVVAAAAGVVTVASDGSYDRCTQCGGSGCGTNTPGGGFANYVVIDHGTHNTTYGHLRNGSVAVSVGDSVACGQVIGHIGSSGCSTGAHLHFQPRRSGASYMDALDPYEGSCSPTTPSLWAEQGPYRGLPGNTCGNVPPQCPADTYETWTCSSDGTSRRRCIDGVDSTEDCTWGCTAMPSGTDDVCALPPDADGDGVRADTDCNDARGDIHPGAVEVCGDGVDQDCSGGDLACDPGGTGGASATGGVAGTGGMATGGGGTTTGGVATGGVATGGGGMTTGGVATGGGGMTTGGVVTGGVATGGVAMGGTGLTGGTVAGGTGTTGGVATAGGTTGWPVTGGAGLGGTTPATPGAPADDPGGCACSTPQASGEGHVSLGGALAGLLLVWARRRRDWLVKARTPACIRAAGARLTGS